MLQARPSGLTVAGLPYFYRASYLHSSAKLHPIIIIMMLRLWKGLLFIMVLLIVAHGIIILAVPPSVAAQRTPSRPSQPRPAEKHAQCPECLDMNSCVTRANNIQSFRCKARPLLRPRKRPQRSISRTFLRIRWLRRPGPWPGAEAVTVSKKLETWTSNNLKPWTSSA